MELQLEGTASSSRCPRGARDVAGELLGGRGVVERLLGGVAGCRCAGGEGEALVPSARGGGERAAGRRLRTTARGPSTRAALHALFGSLASRAYLLVGLQQSDSPKSMSGFPSRRRFARSHGKLEDCAVHQAARSAAWRGAASRSLRKLDEAHIAVGWAGTHSLSSLVLCQSSKRLRINSSPTGRRSSAPGIRIDIGKRPPSRGRARVRLWVCASFFPVCTRHGPRHDNKPYIHGPAERL